MPTGSNAATPFDTGALRPLRDATNCEPQTRSRGKFLTATISTVSDGDAPPDDRLARRNAILLGIGQAIVTIATMITFMTGGLAGSVIAADPSFATLPVTASIVGSFVASAPASLAMQKFGRRPIFLMGIALGFSGALIASYSVLSQNFWLLCLGTMMMGAWNGTAIFYRFAAADTASPAFRPRAISWVLVGGVAAALLSPQLVAATHDWFAPAFYAGPFLGAAMVSLLGFVVIAFVDIPRPKTVKEGGEPARPLREILQQPRLVAAIAAGASTYAMMALVMTSTPLAMIACNHSDIDAANTIGWHVLAMYGPSFFTGGLIARFGRERIVVAGLLLLLGCAGAALLGVTVTNFTVALILLGLGWNFGYIGATAIVTECHRPSERGKVQALNDATVFGFVALSSFLSGRLLATVGWEGVLHVLVPVVLLAIALVIFLMRRVARPSIGAAT